MPRYHLHIQDEDGITADAEGSDLPDLETAREEAIQAARQIMSWAVRDGYWPDERRFVITDENGIVLLEFPFKAALSAR